MNRQSRKWINTPLGEGTKNTYLRKARLNHWVLNRQVLLGLWVGGHGHRGRSDRLLLVVYILWGFHFFGIRFAILSLKLVAWESRRDEEKITEARRARGDVKDKHTYRENDRERDRQNVVKPYTRVYSCTFNIFLQRHLEQRVFLLTEFRIANSTTKEKTITGSTYVNR